ncbi:MAG: ABC transporter substrate-binding protein, partial [Saprospiraceae bacterium]
MARQRLTPFAKLLMVMLVAGGLFFGGKYVYDNFINNDDNPERPRPERPRTNDNNGGDDVIDIGVVTWGGYAGGQYWNKGFEANTKSNFYKDYGFKVKFHVLDDFDASRDAFKTDQVDLLWATIDAFPTEVEGLADYEPQVVFQADWSRGGDAVVVRRGIRTVADLKGKEIAVAPMTPSHTFLIWLLEAGGLTTDDVTIREVPSAIDAADAFKAKSVDAAVVWSPDDADCVDKVPGSRVLQSTKNASHIIADVFFAKKDYIQGNKEQLRQLYEGWMKGSAAINKSESAKKEAAKILADGLNQPEDFCLDAI